MRRAFANGQIAQSVEQGTENPCVPSSILGLATKIYNYKGNGSLGSLTWKFGYENSNLQKSHFWK